MEKKDTGLGVVSLGFGAWVFFMSTTLKGEAAFWPKLVAIAIMIVGAVILGTGVVGLMRERAASGTAQVAKKPHAKPHYIKVAAVVALMIVYLIAFQLIGYTIPTFLLISGTALILGYRNWKILIPTALVVSVGLYLIFSKLFGINFPGVFY